MTCPLYVKIKKSLAKYLAEPSFVTLGSTALVVNHVIWERDHYSLNDQS